jgi:hypothetical protein
MTHIAEIKGQEKEIKRIKRVTSLHEVQNVRHMSVRSGDFPLAYTTLIRAFRLYLLGYNWVRVIQ